MTKPKKKRRAGISRALTSTFCPGEPRPATLNTATALDLLRHRYGIVLSPEAVRRWPVPRQVVGRVRRFQTAGLIAEAERRIKTAQLLMIGTPTAPSKSQGPRREAKPAEDVKRRIPA